MYYADVKGKERVVYYIVEINGEEKCNLILENGGIKINEELHQYLLSLGQCKFIGVKEDKIYTILDKNLFEKVILPIDPSPQPKSQFQILQETVDQLVLTTLGGAK